MYNDFSKKSAKKVAELPKKHYICSRNNDDSRTSQSKSNNNRTSRHPVDLLAGNYYYRVFIVLFQSVEHANRAIDGVERLL